VFGRRAGTQLPRLVYEIDLTAAPIELAAQSLSIVRVQEYAQRHGLTVEERETAYTREYVLMIPAERMNDILWALDFAGLLKPNQRITADSALSAKLEERFSWLEWVDNRPMAAVQKTGTDPAQEPHQITTGVYRILSRLRQFSFPVPLNALPVNGIYFFYEEGEAAELEGRSVPRVVRVGSHTQNGNFRNRMRQHYGFVMKLGGNKNGSVFRRHLGGALLRRDDPNDPRLAEWLKQGGQSYQEVEQGVSETLRGRFSFSCVRVDDRDERLSLESQLIARLVQSPLGRPADGWLGRSGIAVVAKGGLWNVHHVDASPLGADGLRRLEELSHLPLVPDENEDHA
jgi:hypothetical protein